VSVAGLPPTVHSSYKWVPPPTATAIGEKSSLLNGVGCGAMPAHATGREFTL